MSRYPKISAYKRFAGWLLLFSLLLAAAYALLPAAAPAPDDAPAEAGQPPYVTALAGVVIDAHSGQALQSINADMQLPPASTGKVLTALLTLDLCADLQRQTLVSTAAAAVGDSSMGLVAGEIISVEHLLYGALLHSGNDACYALAEATLGSEPFFVWLLNIKAQAIGAQHSNFTNTNGLPDDEHYSSAADLAQITRHALNNDFFAATVASKYMGFGSESNYRYYQNTNKLLWQDEHIVGVKTGTTNAAGPCLIAAYRDGERLYIAVALNSADRYGDCYRLLCYAAAK
ncbi:MAG: serine hydrolase [Bacillota bacterium]|nr:serine hydrolase [Bacillota bacterium]